MNITVFDTYLIGLVDSLKGGFAILSTVTSFVYVVGVISETENNFEDLIKGFKKRKGFLFLCILFILLTIFIPHSKTLEAMYIIPRISNNERVINIPDTVAILDTQTADQ